MHSNRLFNFCISIIFIITILTINIVFYSLQYYQTAPDIMLCIIYYFAIHSKIEKKQDYYIYLSCIIIDFIYNQDFGFWSIYYISLYYIFRYLSKIIQLFSFNKSLLYFCVISYIQLITSYYLYNLPYIYIIKKYILTICSFIIISKIFSKIEILYFNKTHN
jgi:hypothetical protein